MSFIAEISPLRCQRFLIKTSNWCSRLNLRTMKMLCFVERWAGRMQMGMHQQQEEREGEGGLAKGGLQERGTLNLHL